MKTTVLRFCALLILLMQAFAADAQFAPQPFRHPQFTRLDKSKGIGSNAPVDIAIDKDYKYWIASYNGLIEYDGSRFKTHHLPFVMGDQLGSDVMYDIAFRNDSMLWVTHVYGIAQFNIYTKQYSPVPIRAAEVTNKTPYVFRNLFIDREGNTFFFSRQTWVLKYDTVTGQASEYIPLGFDGPDHVYNMQQLPDGNYLLLTRDGFRIFDPRTARLIPAERYPDEYKWMNRPEFRGFTNAYEVIGDLRFVNVLDGSGEGRIYKYDTRNGSVSLVKKGGGRLFYKDSFNHLWLYGFGNQVEVYDAATDSVYQVPDHRYNSAEIDFSVCYSVFEDHEQNVWFCTNNGLLTYNLYQNSYLTLSDKIPGNSFSSVTQVAPDRIWCGTPDKGIYEYRPSTGRFLLHEPGKLGRNPILNETGVVFRQEHRPFVWISHPGGYVSRYDLGTGRFSFFSDSVLAGDDLSFAGDENELFAAGSSGRLYQFDEAAGCFRLLADLNETEGLNRLIQVNTCLYLGKGELLLGTSEAGLLRYNVFSKQYKLYEVDLANRNSISSNLVIILKRFTKDRVFGGTINGIFSYDLSTGAIENFNFNDNFSLSYVTQFGMNRAGNLIIISANGLYLLDWKTKNIIDLARRSNIDKLHLTDVYYSGETNQTFLTSETAFYELLVNPAAYSPKFKPIVHYVSTLDKTYFLRRNSGIVLNRNQNSFQVHFGASTFRHKEDLEYFYKLDDGEWLPASGGVISFSKLRGGTYFFRLRAVYKGNRAISYDTGFSIEIKKAFYESFWFYLLALGAAAAVFYLFYRIRVRRLLAVEKVRFQLSRDLHDDMGSTLSTINILSAITADKIDKDPALARNYIARIAANSQQMMESMDDIVWSINPANDNVQRVIYRMREFASGILEPKNIGLVFDVKEEMNELALSMNIRRDFFLIFKEAVNNAAKYADCTQVVISLSAEQGYLVLTVTDNGRGFDIKADGSGNGLVNMRKRAALIGGDLEIRTAPGKGTSIQLKLKVR